MEQLTSRDVRNVATVIDGGGNEFIAYTEGPAYRARIMRIRPDGKRENIHDVPGDKHSTIDLAVVGANLRIYVAARLDERSNDFPLYRYDLPNVCVPLGSQPGVVAPPAPPPPNITIVQGGGSGNGADPEARKRADEALRQAGAALQQVAALNNGQLPEPMLNSIKDVLWNTPTLKDRIYIWLKDRDPGLTEEIKAIARDAITPSGEAPVSG